jgi:hypothetical protein
MSKSEMVQCDALSRVARLCLTGMEDLDLGWLLDSNHPEFTDLCPSCADELALEAEHNLQARVN